jgi:hypothetical protein
LFLAIAVAALFELWDDCSLVFFLGQVHWLLWLKSIAFVLLSCYYFQILLPSAEGIGGPKNMKDTHQKDLLNVCVQVNGVAGPDAGKFRGDIHDCHFQVLP